MKTLKARFKNFEENNPNASSYICFANAIRGQKFSNEIITHQFSRLVEKDDYEIDDKREILTYLRELNLKTLNTI